MFCAFADEFGMDADSAAKVASGLGGGVGRMREVCGTVTGAALVIGMRGGPDKNAVYPKVQEFCAKFREECGSIVCRALHALTRSGGRTAGRSVFLRV